MTLYDIYDNIDAVVDKSVTYYASDSLTSIKDYAFYSCTSLVSVDIPNVTSIGNYAFYGCTGLQKVWIPSTCETFTATTASTAPFYGCSSLEIYTDVADEDSIPSGWGTYWNYYASGSTLTVHYGATHDEYEAA